VGLPPSETAPGCGPAHGTGSAAVGATCLSPGKARTVPWGARREVGGPRGKKMSLPPVTLVGCLGQPCFSFPFPSLNPRHRFPAGKKGVCFRLCQPQGLLLLSRTSTGAKGKEKTLHGAGMVPSNSDCVLLGRGWCKTTAPGRTGDPR